MKLAVVVFPAASVAVYVTVVVPKANTDPELCELVNVTPEQLSVAVGAVHVAIPLQEPIVLPIVMFAGKAVITGALLSTTVIICVAVAVLPAASVAVQITVVVPIGNATGALLLTVTVVQLSVAIALPKFAITA